jgi:DNA-binding NarL/FixJ family response regulator
MNHDSPRILNIGQCQIDGPWMKTVLEKKLRAVVEEADSASEAVTKARHHRYGLILVNRELARDGSSGLELVPELVAVSPQTPVMIVSDRDEAQASAVERGAAPGFGKRDFETPATLERLEKILHSS